MDEMRTEENKFSQAVGDAVKVNRMKFVDDNPRHRLRRRILVARINRALDDGQEFKALKLQLRLQKVESVQSNVLSKYLCKELFLYFLVCFFFFFAIFFVNQLLLVIETLLKKHVPFFTALRLIIYYCPAIVAQSAPFATLVGFLMCLGRMVTDNEVLILRASGLRYFKVFLPTIIMGILISLFSFLMNDYFLPLGNMKSQQLYKQIATSNPAVELEPNSVKWIDDTALVIGDVDKTHLSDLILFNIGRNQDHKIIIAEDSDIYKSVKPGVLMQLVMNDAKVFFLQNNTRGNYDVMESESVTMNIFEDQFDLGSGGLSPNQMTALDLYRRIKKMKTGNKNVVKSWELEFSKKFSIPFASIFFALLAFPLALVFGRKDGQTLGLIFGLVISVGYWAATLLGQMFGVKGSIGPYMATWAPNIVIGVLGILIYLRLMKK